MKELVKIEERMVGDALVQTVNARELHTFLESGYAFSDWIKARIEQYDFVEGEDWVFQKTLNNPLGGRPSDEYHITIDMGKELAMVERNAKGKEARRYFIECERIAKQAISGQTAPQAVSLATEARIMAALQEGLEANSPAAHKRKVKDLKERIEELEFYMQEMETTMQCMVNNNYSMTAELRALRSIAIDMCNLNRLPEEMKKLFTIKVNNAISYYAYDKMPGLPKE